jgi:hypothetical protein
METIDKQRKSLSAKLSEGYRSAAMLIFNTLVCFLILNFILFIIFFITDKSSPNVIAKKYSNVNLEPL